MICAHLCSCCFNYNFKEKVKATATDIDECRNKQQQQQQTTKGAAANYASIAEHYASNQTTSNINATNKTPINAFLALYVC